MVQRTDLNPDTREVARRLASRISKAQAKQTAPAGVKDLGLNGDVVWTEPNPEPTEEKPTIDYSVRRVGHDVTALWGQADELLEKLTTLNEMLEATQTALDEAETAIQQTAGRYTVSDHDPTEADAEGKPTNAVWEVRENGVAVRRWVLDASGEWVPLEAGGEFVDGELVAAAVGTFLQIDAGQIVSGLIQTGRLNADEVAAAIANIIKINTSQLVVTDTAYLNEAVVKQIAASIAAFNALVVTSDMLANDVGKNLDVSGNPSVSGKADQSDLDALDDRVSEVEPIRRAVVIEPGGITITDNKEKPNQVVISNSRLGFVSDGVEVAYIDGQAETMHISNVEIEDGILIGHHLMKAWDEHNTIVRWLA